MSRRLNIEETALARFCEKRHVRRLSLFGSQLKGTARPGSDVDLLVEFDPEHVPMLDKGGIEVVVIGSSAATRRKQRSICRTSCGKPRVLK